MNYLWRHCPWLLGLLAAPFFLGAVRPEGQAFVGGSLAISWLLCSDQLGGWVRPVVPLWLKCSALALLLIPLLPLPLSCVEWLSPQRAALARSFPADPQDQASWVPLTVSPAATLQRIWELSLLCAAFGLARLAAGQARFPRTMALLLGAAVFLQAACDVWYRLDPAGSPLGWWKPSWHDGAGTFVNRNDFAGWIYMATLCAAGWLLRVAKPLRSARLNAVPPADRFRTGFVLLALGLAFGLAMAVASGSRGGMIAFLAGGTGFVGSLAHRSRSRTRLAILGALAIVAMTVMLPTADLVLRRLAGTRAELLSKHSKLEIWRQSASLFLKFPLFGTGLGTFATACNHYKTTGGLKTFTHTENDYLQWLVETGLAGALVLAGLLTFGLRATARLVWRDRLAEPELVFAACAALLAFSVQAVVEFVFEIPANSLLAAAFLGFCVGSRDLLTRPAAAPPPPRWRSALNLAGAAALLIVATLQGIAAWHWHHALRATSAKTQLDALRHSVHLWPWAMDRQIALARAETRRVATHPAAQQLAEAQSLHARLDQALAWDPFNWELRLERAWSDLTLFPDAARTRAEVWEPVRLNPLQPQIPLRFAQFLATRNPDLAGALLRSADFSTGEYLGEALDLDWRVNHQPDRLWELTPDSPPALLTLGDFALGKKLLPLATQVFQALTNRVAAPVLAEKFLQAQRPDLALSLIPSPPISTRAKLLRARAYLDAGQYRRAIADAESVWQASPLREHLESPGTAGTHPSAESGEASAALTLAEKDFHRPPEARDLTRLQRWHERLPDELRLAWMLYQTELALGHDAAAAQVAVQLAVRIAARE